MDKIIPIHHNFIGGFNKTFSMILPIGVFLHKELQEASIGDILITYDNIPLMLLDKTEISINSKIIDVAAKAIYNMPIDKIFRLLKNNWGDSMDDDLVLYVAVKQLSNEKRKYIQDQLALQAGNINTCSSNRK